MILSRLIKQPEKQSGRKRDAPYLHCSHFTCFHTGYISVTVALIPGTHYIIVTYCTYLGWRYQQNGVDHEDFIVFLTRVTLKSPGASEPLCKNTTKKNSSTFGQASQTKSRITSSNTPSWAESHPRWTISGDGQKACLTQLQVGCGNVKKIKMCVF